MATVSKEQWAEWLGDPVTKEFRRYMTSLITDAASAWTKGEFTEGKTPEMMALLNYAAVEKIKTLHRVAALDHQEYVDFIRDIENDE